MKASETLPSPEPLNGVHSWLSGRRGLIVAAIALAIPAIWLGWPWLLAAGLVPILISLAPCLIMCGLGFCMMRSCSKREQPGPAAADAAARTAGTPELSRSRSICGSSAGATGANPAPVTRSTLKGEIHA